MPHKPIHVSGLICLAAIQAGCGTVPLPLATRPAALPEARAVLYLIGDAGDATAEIPILAQLRNDIVSVPAGLPTIVAFLGDNVYGAGVRNAANPGFLEDSLRLETQIDVVRDTRAHAMFVPGNHDWADGGRAGLRRVQNQAAFIARRAAAGISVEMAPADGCPGPATRALGDAAMLISLDTQWWLHNRTERANPRCPNRAEPEVLEDLARELQDLPPGSRAVVVAHHPLETFGKHGGYFSARYVLFPLTDAVPWLYIPIPFIYPVGRNAGIFVQDLSAPRNRAMRERFVEVFSRYPQEPFIYAAGHEHSVQVMDGGAFGVGVHVVSGAGSKLDDVMDVGRAMFMAGDQHGERGYVKLEFFSDGSALLSVLTDGTTCEAPDACAPGPTLRFAERIR